MIEAAWRELGGNHVDVTIECGVDHEELKMTYAEVAALSDRLVRPGGPVAQDGDDTV